MRKTKKLLALLMSVMVVGGIFTGCGSKDKANTDATKKEESVTINDLVTATKDAFKDKKSGSFDMDLGAGLKLVQDDVSMDIKVSANFGCEADEDTTYTNGKLNLDMVLPEELMAGMSSDDLKKVMEFKSYTQEEKDKNLVYNYDSENDEWLLTEEEVSNEDSNDTESAIDDILDSELMKKLSITTEADGYNVSGKVSVKEIMDLVKDTGVDTDSVDSLGVDLDMLNDVNFEITFLFGNDKVLKSFEALVKSDKDIEYEGASISIDNISIKFTVNKIGDVTVDVPNDVKTSANNTLNESIHNN